MIEQKLMENFAQGIRQAADIVRQDKPDLLIFPIRGGVALADCLRIVDPTMCTFATEYMPSSSSISEPDYNMQEWFKNALKHYHIDGEDLTICSIDEVFSGHSISRVLRNMKRARVDYRIENGVNRETGDIGFKSIGIVDMRYQRQQKQMQQSYGKLLREGLIIPVEVNENLVMDRPDLCPLVLQPNPNDKPHYFPKMAEYKYTQAYLDFLKHFGAVVGQDVSLVSLQNPERIRQSERFLGAKYR